MKGITPIISIIVLLLITVVIAGVAWVYMSGFVGSQIESSFNIPPRGAFCTGGKITVVVNNVGTGTMTQDDFIVANIDGSAATKEIFSIGSKKGSILIKDHDCGSSCTHGDHYIDISTAATTLSRTVVCP